MTIDVSPANLKFGSSLPGSTCPWFEPTILHPGHSCTHIVGYYAGPASPFLGHRRVELSVVARNVAGRRLASKKVIATATPVEPAPVLAVSLSSLSFGEQAYETFETRSLTVTNVSSQPIVLTSDAGLPDDFAHLIDSTCGLGDKSRGRLSLR